MRKFILVMASLILIFGCSLGGNTPTKKVEAFLMQYKDLNEGVVSDLELSSEAAGLSTTEQKEKYIKLMKKQYSNMKYEVVSEKVNGDEATVEVKVTVLDLYKVNNDANTYLENNRNEFMENDVYNKSKFNDYLLKNMDETEDTVDYTLTYNVVKQDGKWTVEEMDTITKQKLHGTYDYES